jgi:hypothetical protein
MKLYRNAIILVVVLGLLVGAYFIINNNKKTTTDDVAEDTTPTITVVKSELEDITSLSFDNKNGSFTLAKKDGNWTMEPASELGVDSIVADASATDLAAIVAEKVIEEKATDLAKYGLDKPSIVKIGLKDGTTKEVEVGSSNATKEGIYVKNKGESKVYLIGSYYENKLVLSKGYFLSKQILPIESTAVKKVSYEKNGAVQFAIDVNSDSDMKITAPYKEEANETNISPILKAIVALEIKDIVDENPADLAKYGLDKPLYAIEFSNGKDTKKILFGKDVEKGSVAYAKFPEGKTVFTIDISGLTFLDINFREIVDSFVYLTNINDVSKIELQLDGKKTVADISTVEGDSKKDKFKVDGKDANMENADGKSLFRNFYSAVVGLTLDKYEPGAKPSGAPEVTIKYYMKSTGKPVTVELISKDSNYYYAMKDGVYTNRVVLKDKLNDSDGIRETLKLLKAEVDKAK